MKVIKSAAQMVNNIVTSMVSMEVPIVPIGGSKSQCLHMLSRFRKAQRILAQRSVVMEPMCCCSMKKCSNTASSLYWKCAQMTTRNNAGVLHVISTMRFTQVVT